MGRRSNSRRGAPRIAKRTPCTRSYTPMRRFPPRATPPRVRARVPCRAVSTLLLWGRGREARGGEEEVVRRRRRAALSLPTLPPPPPLGTAAVLGWGMRVVVATALSRVPCRVCTRAHGTRHVTLPPCIHDSKCAQHTHAYTQPSTHTHTHTTQPMQARRAGGCHEALHGTCLWDGVPVQ